MSEQRPELSIVLPIYNEEDVLPELRRRLDDVLSELDVHYEIIFVDDGSSDNSVAFVEEWAHAVDQVRLVELSRNFGHSAACTAGLDAARGRAVVLMDADLQDPPELIPDLFAKWREGNEIIYAERRRRAEPWMRRSLIQLFHRLFSIVADFPVPIHTGTFSLMDGTVVDHLRQMRERSRFLPGLRSYVGYRSAKVTYDRPDRALGEPKQTYRRLFLYGFDAIFSFSRKPLQMSTLLGLLVATLAAGYGFVLLTLRLMNYNVERGFTTIAAGMFFLGGVQLISLGILGEYISRIYDEVKQRPIYVIRGRAERNSKGQANGGGKGPASVNESRVES